MLLLHSWLVRPSKLHSDRPFVEVLGLVALGLLLGTSGQARSQSNYTYTTLDAQGGLTPTFASGVNASGQIVGYYSGAMGFHGFLFDQGSYTTLDVPNSSDNHASGINAAGQIVGYYSGAMGFHGFLFDQGSYIRLDVPGSTETMASAINASGRIVGDYHTAGGGTYAFLATPVP
jgi:probable HAF family extracellular repeat protein